MSFLRRVLTGLTCALVVASSVAWCDLVSYWPMDEGSGTTAYDVTANTNDGTLMGGATWTTAGMFGSAISFDGTAKWVQCGNDASLAVASGQDFTYSMWFRDAVAGDWAWLLDQNGRGTDSLVYTTQGTATGNDKLRFSMDSWFKDVAHGVTTVQPNVWNHVALTRSGTTVTSYLNGIKEGSTTGGYATAAIGVGSDQLYIGKVAGGPHMNGAIDDVAIWHNATSARKVAAMAGLGDFAGVPQASGEIDDVVALATVGQAATAGGQTWTYTSVFPDANGGSTLKEGLHYIGTNAKQYIILEDQGGTNGLRGVTNAANANLVSHWKFDDGAGQTALDSAVGGNDGMLGTSTGADASDPTWAAGKIGGALQFAGDASTGPDDWVNVSSDPSLAVAQGQDFTYALWFKGPGVGGWRWLLNQGDVTSDGLFMTASGDTIRVSMGTWFSNTINTSGGPLGTDTWNHLALTRSGGDTVKAYLNGVPFATGTSDVALGIARGLFIGKGPATTDGFNGLIDDVGVWHEAVSGRRLAAVAGLGDFAGVDLASSAIDDVVAMTTAGQAATAGSKTWTYTSVFPAAAAGGGLVPGRHYVGTNAEQYIILEDQGGTHGLVGVTTAANANLVSHWKLDDGAGQAAADSAIGGNHGMLGTSTGADASDPTWAAGKIGGALNFAGNGTTPEEYATVPSDPSLAVAQRQDFTYSLWFKGPGVGTWRWLLNQGDAYNDGLFITAQGNAIRVSMGTWFSNTINTSGGVLDADTWYHLALTRSDGDTVTAYLDGVPFATGASDVALGIGRGLFIGKGPAATTGFSGLIDDVGVWHEALSAERLAAIAGLGDFASVDLASPEIDDVLGLSAPGQHAGAGAAEWYYTTMFPTPRGGGSLLAGMHYIGSDGGRYIILSGNAQDGFAGLTTIPEPATLTLVALGLAALARRRRAPSR